MNKKKCRKIALEKLKGLSWQQRYRYDKQINSALYAYIKRQHASTVMLYVPLEIEVDIGPLISLLRRRGVTVLVPFMEGESFRLVKYRLPLQKKKYGVKEPKISKQFRKKRIDIAVVPIVGTDRSLKRIGFGKGMYDRFFMREKKWIDEVIFVQRVLCQCAEQVTDAFDVEADSIIAAH